MYILKKSPRTLGLDEPIRHESHKRPVTRRDFIAQGFMTGPGIVAAPSLLAMLMSNKASALSPDLEALQAACGITNGAGKIPFICFDLAGGANLTGSEILVGPELPADQFPVDAGLRQARPAGQHDAELAERGQRHQQLRQQGVRRGLALGRRHPARHAGFHAGGHACQRERLSDRGAFGERHRQQSAQPDVRHQPHRRRRPVADADRLAEHGLGRQLDGAGVDDESGRASHQGGSRQRRHRPGRHRRAGHAVRQHRRRDRGARVDDAPRSRQGGSVQDQARRRSLGGRRRRRAQGTGQLRLHQVHVSRRPVPRQRPRSIPTPIRSSSASPPASSPRPNTTPTANSARPRPS